MQLVSSQSAHIFVRTSGHQESLKSFSNYYRIVIHRCYLNFDLLVLCGNYGYLEVIFASVKLLYICC